MPEIQSHPCFLTPEKLQPAYPLFVFLPGMDGTGRLLKAQTTGLETAFDVRCLAIPPDDLTSWEELAARVIDLIQAELTGRPRRSVYLCGESFGGCLAMKVILQRPDLFERLILINPASSFQRRPWIAWGSQITRWLPESLYQVSSVGLLPLLAQFDRINATDRRAFLEAVQSVPQATSIWRMELLSHFHVPEAELARVSQPTLLLASANDRLLPSLPEAQRLQQIFPHSQVVVLPASGHVCLLEAAVNLLEIMKAHGFLEVQAVVADQLSRI